MIRFEHHDPVWMDLEKRRVGEAPSVHAVTFSCLTTFPRLAEASFPNEPAPEAKK